MAEDFEDLKTVIAKILLNLTMLNIAENVTFNHLLNNCLLLLDHGCYLSLYNNLSGYLAHSDVDKITYQKLTQIVDILEKYLIINDVN